MAQLNIAQVLAQALSTEGLEQTALLHLATYKHPVCQQRSYVINRN